MAIGLIKGILGILGPFYKKSREGSRQPVNLQIFPNLENMVLDLISVIFKTNDP